MIFSNNAGGAISLATLALLLSDTTTTISRVEARLLGGRQLQSCPPGQEPRDESICHVCDPGTFSPDGNSCHPCSPGQVTNQFEQTSCGDCPAGEFQNQEGQHSCFQCVPGFYQPDPGQTFCFPCTCPLTCTSTEDDTSCEAPLVPPPGDGDGDGIMSMDPHVKKWDGTWYDYNGECDLVLLSVPGFVTSSHRAGLDIHVRTKRRYSYSFIEAAAIRIGEDILEVSSWGQYILNGIANAIAVPSSDTISTLPSLGGYPVFHATEMEKKKHTFVIQTENDHGHNITLSTFKDFVNVHIHVHSHSLYSSQGLMGDYETGDMLARDGKTVLKDPNAFGQEWQVLETEPKLFMADRAPQAPLEQCRLPKQQPAKQHNNNNSVLRQAAVKACQQHAHQNMDACVMDILATGDLELIESGNF